MTLLALQNFGSDVVGSTANGSLPLSVKFELGGQTKVTNFDFHFVIQEQVTNFEISVNDSVRVKVLDSIADLQHIALDLELNKSLSPPEQLVQRLTLTKLQQNVDILSIFEEVLEPDNVLVVQRPVDLDFTHQLLFGPRFRQGRLINYFGGGHFASLRICELVAFGEATLTQELAPDVLLDANVAVEADNFLFYNNRIAFIIHHIAFSPGLLALRSCHCVSMSVCVCVCVLQK